MNPFDLVGATALVTGSSRGIGLALAKGLLCRPAAGSPSTAATSTRSQPRPST